VWNLGRLPETYGCFAEDQRIFFNGSVNSRTVAVFTQDGCLKRTANSLGGSFEGVGGGTHHRRATFERCYVLVGGVRLQCCSRRVRVCVVVGGVVLCRCVCVCVFDLLIFLQGPPCIVPSFPSPYSHSILSSCSHLRTLLRVCGRCSFGGLRCCSLSVCVCESLSGVVFSVSVCVCDLLVFLHSGWLPGTDGCFAGGVLWRRGASERVGRLLSTRGRR